MAIEALIWYRAHEAHQSGDTTQEQLYHLLLDDLNLRKKQGLIDKDDRKTDVRKLQPAYNDSELIQKINSVCGVLEDNVKLLEVIASDPWRQMDAGLITNDKHLLSRALNNVLRHSLDFAPRNHPKELTLGDIRHTPIENIVRRYGITLRAASLLQQGIQPSDLASNP